MRVSRIATVDLMTKTIKRLAAREDGFTLVELLVVILIIGILIAIALPTFLNQQNKAHDSSAQQKLNTAYKVAKSEETSNQGVFPAAGVDQTTAGSLAKAIHDSEPELGTVNVVDATAGNQATSDAAWVAGVTGTGVYIRNGDGTGVGAGPYTYGAAGTDDLELGSHSNSGTNWYLVLNNNGAPTTGTTP
jgi:type IV pilus assembly protein PilA